MVSIDPSKCAVLVVDMQNDFCHRDGHYGKCGEDVSRFVATIDPVNRLIARARGAGATIGYTRLVYDEAGGAIEERHAIKPRHWIPKGRRLLRGSWGRAQAAGRDAALDGENEVIVELRPAGGPGRKPCRPGGGRSHWRLPIGSCGGRNPSGIRL